MSRTRRSRLSLAVGVGALAFVTACSGSEVDTNEDRHTSRTPGTPSQAAEESQARILSNVRQRARHVDVGRKLSLRATSGTFTEVHVTGPDGGIVEGRMSSDRTRWVSLTPLQAASRYRVTGTAVDAGGREKAYEATFRTRGLTLDEQTYPSFVPLQGQTVGVGMPVIVRFDVPVTDRASIERHLRVVSRPAQPGSFHWISSQEVHWRPQSYWRPGTDVTVHADIKGVPTGGGIYGQVDRTMRFQVGDKMVSKVDMDTDQMRVFRNGRLIRTIPITTGRQPDFTTRSGTKVIIEKFRHKRMNSETIGIDPNSADGFDIDDVEYAMRVTYSGEFVHAAPWSVGDQGHANVSHGCTGMSTSNAEWLYRISKVGDVVQYTGTDRAMTLTNGFGDWNASFADYSAGSAS